MFPSKCFAALIFFENQTNKKQNKKTKIGCDLIFYKRLPTQIQIQTQTLMQRHHWDCFKKAKYNHNNINKNNNKGLQNHHCKISTKKLKSLSQSEINRFAISNHINDDQFHFVA